MVQHSFQTLCLLRAKAAWQYRVQAPAVLSQSNQIRNLSIFVSTYGTRSTGPLPCSLLALVHGMHLNLSARMGPIGNPGPWWGRKHKTRVAIP